LVRILFEASVIGFAQAEVLARTGIYSLSSQLLQALHGRPDVDLSLAYAPRWHEPLAGYLAASGMVDLIGKPPYAGDEPLHVFTPYYGVELGELPNPVIHDWLVICDLLPVLHPELFPGTYEAAFRKNTLQFIRPETQVVCISECTRRDFLSLYPGTAARTHVLYPAVADRFHRPVAAAEVERVRRATGIPEGQPYILSVGTLEPRKNLEAVVDAFAAFVAAGGAPTSLVLTGASGWGSEQLQRQIAAVPGLREKVIVTGYVPDDDLPALYAGALCFLYLSYYEGYGLPPMEAFACGCPAVVSDRASLPEVAGDVGILTDPNDVAGVARLIGDFRDGRIDRVALGERSRRHAAPSTWATVAETLVAAMRRVENPVAVHPPQAAATSSPPCRVCGGRAEERFARSAEGGRPARAVHQCVVCGSLTLTGDFSARRTLPPGFAGQADALADRADAALSLVGAPRTEPLLVEGMDDGLLAALLCERGYAACRPRDAAVSSHAGVPNLAGDFAEAVLWSRFEAEADPAEALARVVALHPDAIVVDCPLWSGPQSAAILDDLGDETRFLPTMPGLQRLAERIGYRLHSSGRIHVLVLDPPRKLKAQTVADMHWKLTNDSYFPQLIDSLRRRRREQADIRLRRILGPAAPFRGVGAAARRALSAKKRPFVIEGSFFHLSTQSGIARVWKNIFAEWRKDGFLDRVVLLDRGGTAPRFEGVETLTVEPHHYDRLDVDPGLMQAYCDDLDAAAFCSTYYARPVSTPTLAMIHDMIPEALGFDLTTPMWVEKHDLIRRADRFVCVSERTRRDLLRFFPEATLRPVEVAHPAVDPAFLAPLPDDPGAVLKKHGIDRDYIVYLGGQGGYKGADVLVAAVASLPEAERPLVIFVGDGTVRQEDVERLGYDGVYGMRADDEELRCLLAHALALVNPSHYEGFGLTVLEAFACGCPVICSDGGALPEVAGDAALIFPVGNVVKLAEAIRELADLRVSSRLVMRGQKRLADFSWSELAGAVRTALEELAEGRKKPPSAGPRVLLALHPPEGQNGQFGGPTRRVLATARALDRIGVRAEVVSGNHMPDGDFDVVHVHNIWSPEEALAQVEYFRPRCRRLVFSPIYLDQSEFSIAFGLTKMFAEAASLDDAAALYAPMMEHLRRINPDIDGNLRMLDPEYRARLRRILDTVDHVVFLSEYEKAAMTALEPLGDCGHSIVRNAAGTDWLEGADPDAFRRAAGLSDYVLCVGNLERRKNQLSLAVAWKDEPQPLVLIGGGGDEPYAEQVRRHLRPGWLATGRLDNDALLASAYAGAAAFVLPSLAEGAPLSALEAAAAGTPPALSDRSSEREYFGGFATYFDPTDPGSINAAVKEAMERGRDPAYRAALGDFARKRYSYDRLAASLRDLYAALALPTGRG
jgi:glycosyltransferase involved in cell wall biosynthesis